MIDRVSAPRIADSDMPRWPGLDWLRASAAVLVVMLHAGMAYLVAPMPGLVWATRDPFGHPAVDALSWWINGFVMPLFFVQSGFLAHRVMCSRGPREFLLHRSYRLLVPLASGCLLILPLDLYVWLLGFAAEGKIPLRKLRSLKIDSPLGDDLWGVSHLWFLEYLWVFCVTAWLVCCVKQRTGDPSQRATTGGTSQRQRTGHSALTCVVLTALCGAALWWEPQILIGFRHSWWPLPANFMFYAPWFALGWLVHAQSQERRRAGDAPPTPFAKLCEWRVVTAVGLFAVLYPQIHRHIAEGSTGRERIVLTGLFVLHAWLMVTGLFGISLRRLNRRPPSAVRYVAEASFWIYLFHHPVVGLTQVTLSPVEMPLVAKFGLVTVSGLVLPLLTYQAFIRRTRVGALLTGQPFAGDRQSRAADILPLPKPSPARLRKSA